MPELDRNEFKFPDEQEKDAKAKSDAPEIEIEIEDDTPPEDRNKTPMPKPLVEELEKDELDQYDDAVKNKLKQMRKVWHDERREKEAAMREQQEALRVAKQLLEENKRIKSVLSVGEREFVNTASNAATLKLEIAKKAYKDAYDAGDSDRLVEAQQAMNTANIELAQARAFRLPPLQAPENPVQTHPEQQQYQPPRPDNRAMAWQSQNTWFGQDEEMTAAALGLHEKLRRNGVVVGSDDYYSALDKTMRKRFPEAFESGMEETPQKTEGRQKSATVVAPAVRSTASNKLRLKASQVQLAKKLGLTPEQYAREVMKLEARNG